MLCLFADCAGCSTASVSVLLGCVHCMLLWSCTLLLMILVGVHVAFWKSREFPTQGGQSLSHLPGLSPQDRVFLGCDCMDKHTNRCFNQVGLSSSSNVDFSKVKQFLGNSHVHVHDANIPLHNLFELDQLVPGCLQAALLPRTKAVHKQ